MTDSSPEGKITFREFTMCLKIKEHIEMEISSLEEYMRQREPETVGCKAFDDHKSREWTKSYAESYAESFAKSYAQSFVAAKAEGIREERTRVVNLMHSKGFPAKVISYLANIQEEEVCLLLAEPKLSYSS